jgi:hypothetical protein
MVSFRSAHFTRLPNEYKPPQPNFQKKFRHHPNPKYQGEHNQMSFIETLYLQEQIKRLQEENKRLKSLLEYGGAAGNPPKEYKQNKDQKNQKHYIKSKEDFVPLIGLDLNYGVKINDPKQGETSSIEDRPSNERQYNERIKNLNYDEMIQRAKDIRNSLGLSSRSIKQQ